MEYEGRSGGGGRESLGHHVIHVVYYAHANEAYAIDFRNARV